MTRDEILALKPGRELDALVAEKVMGWCVTPDEFKYDPDNDVEVSYATSEPPEDLPEGYPEGLRAITGTIRCHRLPDFSTDISAAWEVVGKLREMGGGPDIRWDDADRRWWCEVDKVWGWATGETAPEAICKVALLAVMEEGEEHGA